MSRWKIESEHLEERKDSFTAVFTCTNVDRDQHVVVSVTQRHNEPASNLVGALRALAQLLVRAANEPDEEPGTQTHKLN